MRYLYFLSALCVILNIASCKKINYFDERDIITTASTKYLLHRARGFNDKIPEENSWEGIKYGFAHYDGIEVDIVVSNDGTVWLSHNKFVIDENGYQEELFSNSNDKRISTIFRNNSDFKYVRLDELFEYMSNNYPEKYISLDTKRPKLVFAKKHYEQMAKYILNHIAEYENINGHVMVESNDTHYLRLLNNKFGLETYFCSIGIDNYKFAYADFDKGVKTSYTNNFTGLIFNSDQEEKLSMEMVNLAHRLGLKMQVYGINDTVILNEVSKYNLDFVQTDNIDFFLTK